MAVITNIANLSQTASLNGPDGAVDPPSSLDDQDRFLGSFIAMLRDGVGYSAGAAVAALGFTPVRQGGNSSGGTNTVSIGWNGGLGKLVCAVDTNQFGNQWPLDNDGTARGVRSGGNGAEVRLAWNDPGDTPTYLFGGMSPTDGRVVPPGRLRVSYADSAGYAGSAGSAPANGGTSSNSNAVNNISGWNYSNRAKNPVYMWVTDGASNDQYLTQPGNISVASANYANSAGSAPANGGTSAACSGNAASSGYCSGTAENANALQGLGPGSFVRNAGQINSLRNNGNTQLLVEISGVGDRWWAINVSDGRLKTDIVDTQADSLGQILRTRFVGYKFRQDLGYQIDSEPGHFHPVGVVAQEAEEIEPDWFPKITETKQPDQYAMLMSAMHAIQQLAEQVRMLKAKLQAS